MASSTNQAKLRARFGCGFSIRAKVGFGVIERKCCTALSEMGSTCLRWVPRVFMYIQVHLHGQRWQGTDWLFDRRSGAYGVNDGQGLRPVMKTGDLK